jgi:hypothetical protein
LEIPGEMLFLIELAKKMEVLLFEDSNERPNDVGGDSDIATANCG